MALKGTTSETEAALAPLFARMSCEEAVGADCRREIAQAAQGSMRLSAGELIRTQESPANTLPVLCEGVVLATRRLFDGAQQHVSIHVTGDMLDLEGFVLGRTGTELRACSVAHVILFSRPVLDDLLAKHEWLARHVPREMARNADIAREWMLSLGRRSAYQRAAHLLCEMNARLGEAGLVREGVMNFPLNQVDLSDLLGLSVVHVNRKLQELRRQGLIKTERGRLKVLDHDRLIEAAGFDPVYLRARAAI